MSFEELFVLFEEKEDACFFGLERKWNYIEFGKTKFNVSRTVIYRILLLLLPWLLELVLTKSDFLIL